jgi:hypothetical protein
MKQAPDLGGCSIVRGWPCPSRPRVWRAAMAAPGRAHGVHVQLHDHVRGLTDPHALGRARLPALCPLPLLSMRLILPQQTGLGHIR